MKARDAVDSDAGNIANLLEQLGYCASEESVREKIRLLASSAMDAVLVVEDADVIVGVISLHVFELFHQVGRIGRITSLVVSENARGKGVGALLASKADAFFCQQKCVRAEVTSGDHRAAAHQFYQNQGYAPDERRFIKRYQMLDGEK